jgi:hypothetical protein
MHGTRKRIVATAAALAVVLAAGLAVARAVVVYVNGVDVGDLRGQIFKNATVTIDDNGDIHIDAPGYKIEVVDQDNKPMGTAGPTADARTGENPQLSTKYFLAIKPMDAGRAQYDVVVSTNGVERKVIKAGDPELIIEVSAWLHPGNNSIEIAARKNLAGGRKSTSAADSVRVVIGTGHVEGTLVKIDDVKVDFKCDASQLADAVKGYSIIAQ